MGFKFEKLKLQGAYMIHNFSVGDHRGRFTKCFEEKIYEGAGIEFHLSESFVSTSQKNVIRGLHFQTNHPQAKIVSVVQGKVFDVLVDLRLDSPTFKQWLGFELSAEQANALYIPKGFAHGFASLEDDSIVLYQCDGQYDPSSDTGIRFDDSQIAIDWPIPLGDSIHSKRDLELMSLVDYINFIKRTS